MVSAIKSPGQSESDFLDETIAFWQPRTERPLTREDARQTVENVTGVFDLLAGWDKEDRARKAQAERDVVRDPLPKAEEP